MKPKRIYRITMEDHIEQVRSAIPKMDEAQLKHWIYEFEHNNSVRGDYNQIINELRNQLK